MKKITGLLLVVLTTKVVLCADVSSGLTPQLAGERLVVRFMATTNNDPAVLVNFKGPFRLADFPSGSVLNGVRLRQVGTNELLLGAGDREVMLEAQGFPGWTALLGSNDQLRCAVDLRKVLIDLETPSNNAAAVRLDFHDGGWASMGPGSTARYDYFKDKSYYLSGRGKVYGEEADGLKRNLSEFFVPLTGGPLKKVGSGKYTRWQRLTPLTEVACGGKLGETLEIYVGPQKIMLERHLPQTVELPNGTVVELAQNPQNLFLEWKIKKGFCRFWVSGFDCWHAYGLTDQEAAMAWNTVQGAVDLANYTSTNVFKPNLEALVRIANRFSVSVSPGVTFQYANVFNCITYTGNSIGGDASIYDPNSGTVTKVLQSVTTFKGGMPMASVNAPLNSVKLEWGDQKTLNVSGSPGDFKVPKDSKKIFEGGNSSQMQVGFNPGGQIDFESISSDFKINLAPLKDWQVNLKEGDKVTFQYEWQTGVFYGIADPGNTSPVTFQTPEGFTPQVYPGGVITIIGGTEGSILSKTFGTVVFYEGGGTGGAFGETVSGGTFPPFGTPIPWGGPGPVYDPTFVPPRVEQPPVTVSGK